MGSLIRMDMDVEDFSRKETFQAGSKSFVKFIDFSCVVHGYRKIRQIVVYLPDLSKAASI